MRKALPTKCQIKILSPSNAQKIKKSHARQSDRLRARPCKFAKNICEKIRIRKLLTAQKRNLKRAQSADGGLILPRKSPRFQHANAVWATPPRMCATFCKIALTPLFKIRAARKRARFGAGRPPPAKRFYSRPLRRGAQSRKTASAHKKTADLQTLPQSLSQSLPYPAGRFPKGENAPKAMGKSPTPADD